MTAGSGELAREAAGAYLLAALFTGLVGLVVLLPILIALYVFLVVSLASSIALGVLAAKKSGETAVSRAVVGLVLTASVGVLVFAVYRVVTATI